MLLFSCQPPKQDKGKKETKIVQVEKPTITAGVDYIRGNASSPDSNITVVAMQAGTVKRVTLFLENTSAVEVEHADGTIARYCEIRTNRKAGDYIAQGQTVGWIEQAVGTGNGLSSGTKTFMLHLEVYDGTATGGLTDAGRSTGYKNVPNGAYGRRIDLINTMSARDLPVIPLN